MPEPHHGNTSVEKVDTTIPTWHGFHLSHLAPIRNLYIRTYTVYLLTNIHTYMHKYTHTCMHSFILSSIHLEGGGSEQPFIHSVTVSHIKSAVNLTRWYNGHIP